MAKKVAPLLPASEELLRQFSERLRLSRLRRRLTAKQVAERAGMSPMTLRSLERGGSGVTMGAYLAVMQVLGVEKDLGLLVEADHVGRALQDANLPAQVRRPRLPASATPLAKPSIQRPKNRPAAPSKQIEHLHPVDGPQSWIETGGFSSADVLSSLIDPTTSSTKKAR